MLLHLPEADLPDFDIRMADFAHIGVACERALDWPSGSFVQIMKDNKDRQVYEAIEASPVARAMIEWVEKGKCRSMALPPADLFAKVKSNASKAVRNELPTRAAEFSKQLKRVAPVLRSLGIEVSSKKLSDKKKTRVTTVTVLDSCLYLPEPFPTTSIDGEKSLFEAAQPADLPSANDLELGR